MCVCVCVCVCVCARAYACVCMHMPISVCVCVDFESCKQAVMFLCCVAMNHEIITCSLMSGHDLSNTVLVS